MIRGKMEQKAMFVRGERRVPISEWVEMMTGQLRAFEEDQIREREEHESDHLSACGATWEDRFTDWRIGLC